MLVSISLSIGSILELTDFLPRWLPHNNCLEFVLSWTNDLTLNKISRENDTKDIFTFLPSLFHIHLQPTTVICTTRSSRKQLHSIFYLFLFIDDHVHNNNFYTVMFHLLSINQLKLFLRFILLFSCSLYVRGYRSHICLRAEIYVKYLWNF